VLLLLLLGYKLRKYGANFGEWFPERSGTLHGAIQAASEKRKGRLEFPDSWFTKQNVSAFFEWVWVWMK